MIFIMLIHISGCVSTRTTTSSSDLPATIRHNYVIHSQNSNYLLENTLISSGMLSGKVYEGQFSLRGNKIHVYLSSDSTMKINTEMILTIPLDDIARFEIVKVRPGKTILLVLGILLPLIVLTELNSWEFY
jgi:hypothetical protein